MKFKKGDHIHLKNGDDRYGGKFISGVVVDVNTEHGEYSIRYHQDGGAGFESGDDIEHEYEIHIKQKRNEFLSDLLECSLKNTLNTNEST